MSNGVDRGFAANLKRLAGTLPAEVQKQAKVYEEASSRLAEIFQEADRTRGISSKAHDLFFTAEARQGNLGNAALKQFETTRDSDQIARTLVVMTADAVARKETIETLFLERAPNSG